MLSNHKDGKEDDEDEDEEEDEEADEGADDEEENGKRFKCNNLSPASKQPDQSCLKAQVSF